MLLSEQHLLFENDFHYLFIYYIKHANYILCLTILLLITNNNTNK